MPADPSAIIAPTARVHPDAEIGSLTVIGDFCVVETDVTIGSHCRLEPYVYVKRWTTMGDFNEVSAGTVLGTDPLDKTFSGERSYLRIGHRNRIREHFTISRGTEPESVTEIGNDNYIMTAGHIAHNSTIGNEVVIASTALVAGYVEIEDQAFVSGGVVVHQYSRIGRLAMLAGNVRVNQDAAPYCLYSGFDITPHGLNLVGLRRAGLSRDDIAALKVAYRHLFRSELRLEEALGLILAETDNPHTRHMVEFVRKSKRGIARRARRVESG